MTLFEYLHNGIHSRMIQDGVGIGSTWSEKNTLIVAWKADVRLPSGVVPRKPLLVADSICCEKVLGNQHLKRSSAALVSFQSILSVARVDVAAKKSCTL
jgi:hypothetical protein